MIFFFIVAIGVTVAVAVLVVSAMRPVAFAIAPSTVVMIPSAATPGSAVVGRTRPASRSPHVVPAMGSPIAWRPHKTNLRHRGRNLIPDGRRRSADVDRNLAKCRSCKSRDRQNAAKQPFSSHESPSVLPWRWRRLYAPGRYAGSSAKPEKTPSIQSKNSFTTWPENPLRVCNSLQCKSPAKRRTSKSKAATHDSSRLAERCLDHELSGGTLIS